VARSKEEYRCHPPEQADINWFNSCLEYHYLMVLLY
jgi:hypothetical protein